MSQHPSLRVDSVGKKHRNVLKRLERIKRLTKDSKWDDARSVYGLPKVKSQKIKVKSTSEPKEGEAAAAGETAAPAAATPAKGAKPAKPNAKA